MNYLDKIEEISKIVGSYIRENFRGNFIIEQKGSDTNLVTEVDKNSEKMIIDYLKKNFPDYGIIAEESGNENSNAEYKWLIDPLDGTTNFAHGLPIFSISIGLVKGEEIIAGGIYDIMRDSIYLAEKGAGSYCNNRKIFVSKETSLRKALLVTGFPYDIASNPEKVLDRFNNVIKKSRGVRRLGSAAIDFCYVAEGAFDGYWEVFLNPWDMCAGILIVREAGGKVTNFQGKEMTPFDKRMVASNGLLHKELLNVINEV